MQNRIATITTGEASLQNQTAGLAKCLSSDVKQYIVRPPNWFGKLPAFLVPSMVLDLPDIQSAEVLISCGRKSGAFSLALKRKFPELFTIHIHNPQIPTSYFDLVIPMQHDQCKGNNVFAIETAIHHLQQADLLLAKKEFKDRLDQMPEKKIAFLLGGNTKDYSFTEEEFTSLVNTIDHMRQQGVGVLLTTGRRTPITFVEKLKNYDAPDIWVYTGNGKNPYQCFLAAADGFVITAESVSMISDALFTGRPVNVLPLQGFNKRLDRFINQLLEKQMIRKWNGEFQDYEYKAVDSKQAVAGHVLEKLAKRFHR